MSEKLQYAGQYTLVAADVIQSGGLAIDVRDQIQLINIYEDLFSPFMSGSLAMVDTNDLPSLFANSGTDLLRLVIKTPTIPDKDVISRYFHIYKLSDRIAINERSQTYMLHFISVEALVNSSFNIGKTFKGKAEENISSILKENLKTDVKFNASSTVNDVYYTSNLWSSVDNIAFNADYALSANGTPSMLFFENREGFQFKSLVDIYNSKPVLSFAASNNLSQITEGGINNGDVFKDLQQDYSNISSVVTKEYYDYYKDKANGLMSSRLFSYDLTTKKLKDITYNSTTDKRARANPNKFYTDAVVNTSYKGSTSTILMPHLKHSKLYNGTVDVSDFKTKQKRIALLRNFQQHKIEITVLGRTDYTVGMCIAVDINKMKEFNRGTDRTTITDPMVSGNYVISAIYHRFDREGKHESTIECIRDAIGKVK